MHASSSPWTAAPQACARELTSGTTPALALAAQDVRVPFLMSGPGISKKTVLHTQVGSAPGARVLPQVGWVSGPWVGQRTGPCTSA